MFSTGYAQHKSHLWKSCGLAFQRNIPKTRDKTSPANTDNADKYAPQPHFRTTTPTYPPPSPNWPPSLFTNRFSGPKLVATERSTTRICPPKTTVQAYKPENDDRNMAASRRRTPKWFTQTITEGKKAQLSGQLEVYIDTTDTTKFMVYIHGQYVRDPNEIAEELNKEVISRNTSSRISGSSG